MKEFGSLQSLKIILGIFFLFILSYNFYIANSRKFDSVGDAASFVNLGVGLAKLQKYGYITTSETIDIISAFQKKKIAKEEIQFVGHSTWRPPVWPFLVAGIFLTFGYNLTYILIFKFLLHLIGIFIFYKTLKLVKLREILIVIGTFLYAISPAWQLYSRVFLSEPITLFFITLWIYLLIRFIQKKSHWWTQALVAGVLVLSHPYYIFLPFSVWLILFLYKQKSLKLFILSSALCAAVISTWIIRNFITLETNEIVLTTSSGAVMAKGWNREVPENHTNTKGDLADETLVLQDFDYDRDREYNEVEKMVLYKDASVHFIKTHPELVLPIIGKKLASAFNPFPETSRPGILETGRWIFHLFALISLLYILIFSNNGLIKALVLALILSTIAITILTYSGFRFRMPQVGLEMLFIIYSVEHFIRMRGVKSGRRDIIEI